MTHTNVGLGLILAVNIHCAFSIKSIPSSAMYSSSANSRNSYDSVDYLDKSSKPDKYGGHKEYEARELIEQLNGKHEDMAHKYIKALWKYKTEMTKANLEELNQVKRDFRDLRVNSRNEVIKYDDRSMTDFNVKRPLILYANIGYDILTDEDWKEVNKIEEQVVEKFNKKRVSHFYDANQTLNFNEIQEIVAKTFKMRNLHYYWREFYNQFGIEGKDWFQRYVELTNDAADLNEYETSTKFYYRDWPDNNLNVVAPILYQKIALFYKHLHAYVRNKLRQKYGFKTVSYEGHIPMHLLRDFTASNWLNIYKLTKPYPLAEEHDVAEMFMKQNYTVTKLAKMAEGFFKSMYMRTLPKRFWKRSILEKPNGAKNFDCQPESMDFFDGQDYRLKMCGKINEATINTLYSEMGKLQYMINYQDQPYIFRHAVNGAFENAIKGVAGLTVNGLTYKYKMQYIKKEPTHEQFINYLYKLALDKLVSIPYSYSMDLFRLMAINGSIRPEDYNLKYWRLRRFYTGVGPGTYRSENTFDAAANIDLITGKDFISDFLGTFLSFIFHDNLCKKSSHYKDFENTPEDFEIASCDLFGQKNPGAALEDFCRLGNSGTWTRALHAICEDHQIRAGPLVNFFRPLFMFLREDNAKNKERIGWI